MEAGRGRLSEEAAMAKAAAVEAVAEKWQQMLWRRRAVQMQPRTERREAGAWWQDDPACEGCEHGLEDRGGGLVRGFKNKKQQCR